MATQRQLRCAAPEPAEGASLTASRAASGGRGDPRELTAGGPRTCYGWSEELTDHRGAPDATRGGEVRPAALAEMAAERMEAKLGAAPRNLGGRSAGRTMWTLRRELGPPERDGNDGRDIVFARQGRHEFLGEAGPSLWLGSAAALEAELGRCRETLRGLRVALRQENRKARYLEDRLARARDALRLTNPETMPTGGFLTSGVVCKQTGEDGRGRGRADAKSGAKPPDLPAWGVDWPGGRLRTAVVDCDGMVAEDEKGAEVANITGPGGVPLKDSCCPPNCRRSRRFIPCPRQTQLPPDATWFEGGAERVGEEERVDELRQQRPRRRHPPPFFFRQRLVRGLRTQAQQPQQAQTVDGFDSMDSNNSIQPKGNQFYQIQVDKRDPVPRFRPEYCRPSHPRLSHPWPPQRQRPMQQSIMEGGDGKMKVTRTLADRNPFELQRQRSRFYFQRRRQQRTMARQMMTGTINAKEQSTPSSAAAGEDTPAASILHSQGIPP